MIPISVAADNRKIFEFIINRPLIDLKNISNYVTITKEEEENLELYQGSIISRIDIEKPLIIRLKEIASTLDIFSERNNLFSGIFSYYF